MLLIAIKIILVVTLMVSCLHAPKHEMPAIFDLLEGSWSLENRPVIEKWVKDDGHLAGLVFLVRQEDTVITEALRLFEAEGNFWYEATVPDQNNGKPVQFQLTDSGEDFWVFTNKAHDFPDQITYRFVHADSFTATIEGDAESGRRSIDFKYHKIK
jgi:hypothetical protein